MTGADILAAVKAGQHAPLEWVRLPLTENLAIEVTTDALMVDGMRRATTPQTAQQLADVLDCALWSQRVSDLAWRFAEVRIDPQIQATRPKGSPLHHPCSDCKADTTSPWDRCFECGERMHSAAIESAVMREMRCRPPHPSTHSPLVAPTGKQWVLVPDWSAHDCYLYGWQRSNGVPWQPLSYAHPLATSHVDYSMLWRAWRPATPSGSAVDWQPALDELRIPSRRIPGVPHA